jgi:predicted GIY-YIG superfamily endonuclease
MWHVYVLRSSKRPFLYVGSTNDLMRRLQEHNAGLCISTKAYMPLDCICHISFPQEAQARKLEQYFKTGSGRTMLKKRILNDEDLARHEVLSEA